MTGFYIAIEGSHADLVKFYFDGHLIASDNIRNGDNLNQFTGDVWPAENTSLGNQALAAVRYGELRDSVSVYAFVNGKVYRSKAWEDSGPGNIPKHPGVSVLPLPSKANPDSYFIQGFPFCNSDGSGGPTEKSSFGHVTFNFPTLQWSYDIGNGAGWSTNPQRDERILVIEP